jgi:hypothetical protein
MSHLTRRIAVGVASLGLVAGAVGITAPAAFADKVKNCGTTTTVVGPGNSGMTETVTETQTAQCHSSSDSGEVITTGPVTNRGGGTPGGQQP